MAIFFQHVGERGGQRDFPKTIGTPSAGLAHFELDQIAEITEGLPPDEIRRIEDQIQKEAPNGFGAYPVVRGQSSPHSGKAIGCCFWKVTDLEVSSTTEDASFIDPSARCSTCHNGCGAKPSFR
jgi:hypothetical protein